MIRYSNKHITVKRGDTQKLEFKYKGDLRDCSISLVVKSSKEFASPRLVQKLNDIAGGDDTQIKVEYLEPYTLISAQLEDFDTVDMSAGTYYYDIEAILDDNTRVVKTIYEGQFKIEADVQTPFDGMNLPGTGVRFTTVALEMGSIDQETITWSNQLLKWVPSGKPLSNRTQAANIRYVTKLTSGINEYTTIGEALQNYQPGDVIILAPEYFNEDVVINLSNVYIQGVHKEKCWIKSLTVNGADFNGENFTVVEDASFLSQAQWDWFNRGIQLKNIIFRGNLNLGTPTTRMTEAIVAYDCAMLGGQKNLIINITEGNSCFYDFTIQPPSSAGSNIYVYGGNLTFVRGKAIYIDILQYMIATNYCQIGFVQQHPMRIGRIITMQSTAFHVLFFDACRIDLGYPTGGDDFIFNGIFEIDIMNSSIAIWKNIVFNSSANSRFLGFHQRGWTSNTIITGSSLNFLRIYGSSFKCAAPAGLGDDRNNVWNAFIDD